MMIENLARFSDCTSEMNNTQIDNMKDIDVVMPIYNLIEYTEPENIGPQDVSSTIPTNVPRTSPKDPIWPSCWRPKLTSPDLTSWGRLKMTSNGRLYATSMGRPWQVDSGHPIDNLENMSEGLVGSCVWCPYFFLYFNFLLGTY